MENNWVRLEIKDDIFFVPTHNIAGIHINKRLPQSLSILMIGDEEPTKFIFESVQERNEKLNELMRTASNATGKNDVPQKTEGYDDEDK